MAEEICNEEECFQTGTPGCECYEEGICTSCEKYFPEDERTVQEQGTFCHECWQAFCEDEWEQAMADRQYYASR